VYLSDDDGRTWVEKLALSEQEGLDFSIGALAYDPDRPWRVFRGGGRADPGVKVSNDGGESWADLGGLDREVTRLILGVDSRYLYALASDGLYRFALRS
jgi:hypothetical protein